MSGKLLAVGILSNTLNFGAHITHQRDRKAFQELQELFPLSPEWREQYFVDQEKEINKDVAAAITHDTEVVSHVPLGVPLVIGQLELWDGESFLMKNTKVIRETLRGFGSRYWCMTLPSLKEAKNYLYAENQEVRELLSRALGATFQGRVGTTNELWLRKEILKKLASL